VHVQDALAKAVADAFRLAGVQVDYTPAAGGIPAFNISAIFGGARYDELDRHFVRDLCECRIRHTDLAAHGVSEPTVKSQKSQGDQITATDPNGSPVTWAVVDLVYEHGLWILTLEKHVRIVA
jgi:hypothetical protein